MGFAFGTNARVCLNGSSVIAWLFYMESNPSEVEIFAYTHISFIYLQQFSRNSITYAASQTASVDFAAKIVAQPGKEALAQGALQFFIGGGSMLGVGLGGWIQDRWGPVVMYRVSALVVVGGTSIFALTIWIIRAGVGRNIWAFRGRHHVIPQEDVIESRDHSGSDVEMIDQIVKEVE
jgi:hypothetical protein